MTSRLSQITDVIPMLDVVYQSRQMALSKVLRRISDLEAQIADLDRPRTHDLTDPATRVGADLLWETWVIGRKAALQRDLALVMRDRENIRADVAQALSRLEVARTLRAKLQADKQREISRRIN